jgi:hypothetical protein
MNGPLSDATRTMRERRSTPTLADLRTVAGDMVKPSRTGRKKSDERP